MIEFHLIFFSANISCFSHYQYVKINIHQYQIKMNSFPTDQVKILDQMLLNRLQTSEFSNFPNQVQVNEARELNQVRNRKLQQLQQLPFIENPQKSSLVESLAKVQPFVNANGREELKELFQHLNGGAKMVGYQVVSHASQAHTQVIQAFSSNLLINVANPYNQKCIFTLNSNKIETQVIDFFADLFNVKDHWGYVSSGSTQAILEGCMIGKRFLKKTYGKTPIFIFSKPSHYSHKKAARILDLDTISLEVNSQDQIDIQKFEEFIKDHDKSVPLLMNINIGTTMKGAVDDHRQVIKILKAYDIKYYLHADMAAHGPIFRFTKSFDQLFSDEISSWNISGHKFFGSPYCCAIFMGKKQHIQVAFEMETKEQVTYINSVDLTISGSRNGILPIILYESIRHGVEPIKERANHCLEMTELLKKEFDAIGFPSYLNPQANVIWFKTPSPSIIQKYSLAVDRDISHIFCMADMTPEFISEITQDFRNELP